MGGEIRDVYNLKGETETPSPLKVFKVLIAIFSVIALILFVLLVFDIYGFRVDFYNWVTDFKTIIILPILIVGIFLFYGRDLENYGLMQMSLKEDLYIDFISDIKDQKVRDTIILEIKEKNKINYRDLITIKNLIAKDLNEIRKKKLDDILNYKNEEYGELRIKNLNADIETINKFMTLKVN